MYFCNYEVNNFEFESEYERGDKFYIVWQRTKNQII